MECEMKITFVGHRLLFGCDRLFEKVKDIILENTTSDRWTTFYCGGYGDFDDLCARACRAIKELRPHAELLFVTPYITETQQKKIQYLLDCSLYDSSVYPPLENVPPRFAINKRNEWMINQADLIIAYVDHTFGGAYKTLEYAKRKKKRIINLAI